MKGKSKPRYQPIKKIGPGGFNEVYKCRDRETGNTVAMKMIYFENEEEGVPSSVIREVSLLKEMEHENIVRLLDVLSSEENVSLVFEYLDCDLFEFMEASPTVSKDPRIIKNFMHQILCGVAYCHSEKILHRNLRRENILVDRKNYIVKVAGFGLARPIDVPLKEYTTKVETFQYLAPELLLGNSQYSTPVDVWAVGCIFAEMVNRYRLFRCISENQQLLTIFSVVGVPNEETCPGIDSFCRYLGYRPKNNPKGIAAEVPGLEPSGIDLLSRMLCLDPHTRITAHDALVHEYFKDLQNVRP